MTNKEYRLNMLLEIAYKENWFNRFQWKVLNSQDIDGKLELLDAILEKEDEKFKQYINSIEKNK